MSNNTKYAKLLTIILILICILSLTVIAADNDIEITNSDSNLVNNNNNNKDNIETSTDEATEIIAHFFYGDGCPHCADEEPFLEEFQEKYPHFKVKKYQLKNTNH